MTSRLPCPGPKVGPVAVKPGGLRAIQEQGIPGSLRVLQPRFRAQRSPELDALVSVLPAPFKNGERSPRRA